MDIGMIGLGRMGANMVHRLVAGGHRCVVFDHSPTAIQQLAEAIQPLAEDRVIPVTSVQELVSKLRTPRAIWIMVPAQAVEQVLADLVPHLDPDDILVDGGNSHFENAIRIEKELAYKNIHYVDVGTSGGVMGLQRGYCLMIGGPRVAVDRLDPIFRTLAPGIGGIPRTSGRSESSGTVEEGYLHCGPSGAGHFVKMVHNGIEYGLMAAYAEGMDILRHANVRARVQVTDAGTTALADPDEFRFDFNLQDIAEVWRRGSVISSWLLDLAAAALVRDPELTAFEGRVSDSGEGRWAIKSAVDEGVPTPVLTSALYSRFASRGESKFANKLLSALRFEFGAHAENGPAQQ